MCSRVGCVGGQEALAEEQRMAARYANDIEIAKSQRDFELKKAAYDQEVQTKTAQSKLAYDLQVRASLSRTAATRWGLVVILIARYPDVTGFDTQSRKSHSLTLHGLTRPSSSLGSKNRLYRN